MARGKKKNRRKNKKQKRKVSGTAASSSSSTTSATSSPSTTSAASTSAAAIAKSSLIETSSGSSSSLIETSSAGSFQTLSSRSPIQTSSWRSRFATEASSSISQEDSSLISKFASLDIRTDKDGARKLLLGEEEVSAAGKSKRGSHILAAQLVNKEYEYCHDLFLQKRPENLPRAVMKDMENRILQSFEPASTAARLQKKLLESKKKKELEEEEEQEEEELELELDQGALFNRITIQSKTDYEQFITMINSENFNGEVVLKWPDITDYEVEEMSQYSSSKHFRVLRSC